VNNVSSENRDIPDGMAETLEEFLKATKTNAEESITKLIEIAQSANAVNLFVALFANMALGPAEHISEMTHGDVPAKLELFAYHIFPFFGVGGENTITPWHTQHCWEALDKVFFSRMFDTYSKHRSGSTEQIDSLLMSLRSQAEVVRGSAYPEQTSEEIVAVQGKFDNWFAQQCGIAPTRAVDLMWAIMKALEYDANNFMGEVYKSGQVLGELWKTAKKKPLHKRSASEQHLLNICADKKTAEMFGFVKRLNELAPSKLPVSFSSLKYFDPALSEKEWTALCGLIGLTEEKRQNMRDPVEVRQTPLFVLHDNRVLLADISNALDCLWERFEKIARNDQNFYNKRYQRRKADWLEDKVIECLKQIFPAEHIYRKLSYPDPDKPDGSTAELDFAVFWPPFIVLIEVKAKQFRIESQLGDIGRLRSDVKANIDDAFEQAKRARRYIDATETPEFIEIETGKKLRFEKLGIRRTYLLTISQHHLSGIVNHFDELKGMGLFKDGEYPLSICIADLETISKFCNGPDVLLHFIERRIKIQQERLEVMADELNFFGTYLSCRLQAEQLWKKDGQTVDSIWIAGGSEQFDKLMEYRRGERKEAPTIELMVPSEIKEILTELRRRDDPAARWIAFSLLDMSDVALNSISQILREVRAATLTPNMFRSVTHQDGETSISIVASLDLPPDMLRARTRIRALIEKYRRKVLKSIGIGIMITDGTKPFDCSVWAEGPWEYNEQMEKCLRDEPPLAPLAGQKLPGRNDPCICGSKKKFKKCCLPRIEST